MALKNGINARNARKGEVRSKNCIGLADAGYKALWDADHIPTTRWKSRATPT